MHAHKVQVITGICPCSARSLQNNIVGNVPPSAERSCTKCVKQLSVGYKFFTFTYTTEFTLDSGLTYLTSECLRNETSLGVSICVLHRSQLYNTSWMTMTMLYTQDMYTVVSLKAQSATKASERLEHLMTT